MHHHVHTLPTIHWAPGWHLTLATPSFVHVRPQRQILALVNIPRIIISIIFNYFQTELHHSPSSSIAHTYTLLDPRPSALSLMEFASSTTVLHHTYHKALR